MPINSWNFIYHLFH